MTGDTTDIAARIRAVLPARWFPDDAPVLASLIDGLANAWSAIHALLRFVRAQARLATATGAFLDMVSQDFFATRLPRRPTESDDGYRSRISFALKAEHATRTALDAALRNLTGLSPLLFEAARPADTGSYAGPALGYGVAGAWGNLSLPFQVLVTARRPPPAGIAEIAGYGTPGPLARASLSQSGSQVTDDEIYATITSVMPTASIAWTRITN